MGTPRANKRSAVAVTVNAKADDAVSEDVEQQQEQAPPSPPPPTRENKKKSRKRDVSPDNQVKEVEKPVDDRLDRTLFVGNVPLGVEHKVSQLDLHYDIQDLKKHFATCGTVAKVRLRGIPVAEPGMTKKVAAIKQKFHASRDSCNAYVVFADRESAANALETMKGSLFKEHHLHLDWAAPESNPKFDEDVNDKSIFVGNMPFDVKDEAVWRHFDSEGGVEAVRVIRDAQWGMGKGFGYVRFKTGEMAQNALKLHGSKLQNRELRVFPSETNAPKADPNAKKKKKPKKDAKGKGKGKGKKSVFENVRGKPASFQGRVSQPGAIKRRYTKKH